MQTFYFSLLLSEFCCETGFSFFTFFTLQNFPFQILHNFLATSIRLASKSESNEFLLFIYLLCNLIGVLLVFCNIELFLHTKFRTLHFYKRVTIPRFEFTSLMINHTEIWITTYSMVVIEMKTVENHSLRCV